MKVAKASLLSFLLLSGCLLAPAPTTQPAAVTPIWNLPAARQQCRWWELSRLPQLAGKSLQSLELQALSDSPTPKLTLWTRRQKPQPLSGPEVQQFCGLAQIQVDPGAWLEALKTAPTTAPAALSPAARAAGVPVNSTEATSPLDAPVLRVEVPATVPAGLYRWMLRWRESGKPPETAAGQLEIQLQVDSLVMGRDPAIQALATATARELAEAYPESLGAIQTAFLDRDNPEHRPALAQMDTLVSSFHAAGMTFWMEDLAPLTRVDEVGRVTLDWDAYDRTVFPYLDGSAFEDRIGFSTWLIPNAPRRLWQVPGELRQFWKECLEHHRQKGWTAMPVLYEPRLFGGSPPPWLEKLVRDLFDESVLIIAPPGGFPQRRLIWGVNDADFRLPPVGNLGDPQSLRVWPWMCRARGIAGLHWPHALGGSAALPPLLHPRIAAPAISGTRPAEMPVLTQRLTWLSNGLADLQLFRLLERRSDPKLAANLLAGLVGRTGLETGEAGYLYAGWPSKPEIWDQMNHLMQALVRESAPGQSVELPASDPKVQSARLWLAGIYRPVARVEGFHFGLEATRDGMLLSSQVDLRMENPTPLTTGLALRWPQTLGDFQERSLLNAPLAPLAIEHQAIQILGHLEGLRQSPPLTPLTIREKNQGNSQELSLLWPVQRIPRRSTSLKIDGSDQDWSDRIEDQIYGSIPVACQYQDRPSLLEGLRPTVSPAAWVRGTFDDEYLFLHGSCQQETLQDDRTSEWLGAPRRWWGGDGWLFLVAGGTEPQAGEPLIEIAIKPSGIVLVRQASIPANPMQVLQWSDGPGGLKYGIKTSAQGYQVELAIPRRWLAGSKQPAIPAWRLNVTRHQGNTLQSSSWSGPLQHDEEWRMMGLILGNNAPS